MGFLVTERLNQNNIKFNFWISPNYEIIDDRFPGLVHKTVSNQRYMSLSSAAISIIEMARISDLETVCILEDDCFFTPGWEIEFERFMNEVPSNWNVLNLGFVENSNGLVNITPNVKRIIGRYWGGHCIVYNRNVFDYMLNIYIKQKGNVPYDWIASELYCNKNNNCYTPTQKIIRQISIVDGLSYNQDVESEIKFKSKIGASK